MFPDLLGKLPRVLSASRKPHNRISLLPPTCVPPASLYGHPSRYHHETPSITSRPIPESLRLHCIYPASPLHPALRPVSLSHHSCVPCHPAFSCVTLYSPAFSCVILCLRLASSVVSSSLERSVGFPDWNESIPLPVSIFPRVPIIHSLFRDLIDPSILLPIPCVQFRGDFVSGLSKSSSPFLPPFSASLRVRSSVIPSSLLLPSTVSSVISWSSPPFVALKAVVCFSFPPSSPNCSYRVPSSRRTRFHI